MTDDSSLHNILHLLADGKFHSGQEVGDLLGVSRTAVWKHLQKLDAMGVSIITLKGKGYCLEGGLDLLDAQLIRKHLIPETLSLLSALDIQSVIDSTNDRAMKNGARHGSGYVCLAEQQTAGKGRRGRQWVSPYGKNIYLSAVWSFDGVAILEGLSLAVGVVVVDALRSCGVTDVEVKWPNDLLWRGRKLAGILLEMSGDPSGNCQVVVGIGINVDMPSPSATTIDQPWVDIQTIMAEYGVASMITRNQLVAALLMRLLPMMSTYAEKKFSAYRARWEALNAHAGLTVELRTASDLIVGQVLGVNDAGALRLQTAAGEQLFHGGEVSLRAAP